MTRLQSIPLRVPRGCYTQSNRLLQHALLPVNQHTISQLRFVCARLLRLLRIQTKQPHSIVAERRRCSENLSFPGSQSVMNVGMLLLHALRNR